MTANDPSRRHFPGLAAKPPLFFRTESGDRIRFDHEVRSGEPRLALVKPALANSGQPAATIAGFTLGDHLGPFLEINWNALDWGRPLAIWEGSCGERGIGMKVTGGRLDFLCRDTATNALVVVKIKGARRPELVVGEVAKHMGWVRVHIASPEQKVEGIIVADGIEDSLKYAVSTLSGIRVITYGVTFKLRPAQAIGESHKDRHQLRHPTWGW